MSKRSRKKRKRRSRSKTPSYNLSSKKRTRALVAPTQSLEDLELGEIFDLPILQGPVEPDEAWDYLVKFSTFESWISTGGPPKDADFEAIPTEHRFMLDRWPEGFEFYRHAMYTYLERVNNLNPWTSTVRSLLMRARAKDQRAFDRFLKKTLEGLDRFKQQRNNVLEKMKASRDHGELKDRLRAILEAYAATYEIDLPLWYLGVLARAYRTGELVPELFGGPTPSTSQGTLVDQIASSLSETPLHEMFEDAYLPDLRNAIQHNSYEMRIENEQIIEVNDLNSGASWDGERVFTALTNTTQLMNAVHTVSAYADGVFDPKLAGRFADYGIVSVGFQVHGERALPGITIFQLWCFHEVDTEGTWLDAAEIEIEKLDSDVEKVGFTPHAYSTGKTVSTTKFGEALKKHGWAHVIRVPVAPALGMGYPRFTRPDKASYEIVGLTDEHLVPLRKLP